MLDYYDEILNDMEIVSEKHENEFDYFVDKINEFYTDDLEKLLFNIKANCVELEDLHYEKVEIYCDYANCIVNEIQQLARNLEVDIDDLENYELLKLLEVNFDENFKNEVILFLL